MKYRYKLRNGIDDNCRFRSPYSKEFFNDLYHRFLLSSAKASMRCMCLKAMTIVYERCIDEIGKFNDIKFIVGMLERTNDR